MEFKIENGKQGFNPVKIELVIESYEELNEFYARFNTPIVCIKDYGYLGYNSMIKTDIGSLVDYENLEKILNNYKK